MAQKEFHRLYGAAMDELNRGLAAGEHAEFAGRLAAARFPAASVSPLSRAVPQKR